MKKIKMGFTLAEVLITLSIIGIVAAITLPSVMSSYQYKTVGVKLSKFMSTTEDSARAYVVANDSFKGVTTETTGTSSATTKVKDSIIQDFISEIFMIKELQKQDGTKKVDENESTYEIADYALLKDGTRIKVEADDLKAWSSAHKDVLDARKTGMPAIKVAFEPKVTGLPKATQKQYDFVITELGYVFPAEYDECLWLIYDDNWVTNSKTFKNNTSCQKEKPSSTKNSGTK